MRKPPPYNKKVNPISFMISPITTFTDEEIALNYLEELLEEGEDRSEMEAFIEEHGHKNFYDHFDEYRDLQLEDELQIGYDVEEDLPDALEDDSWIDGLLTSGFNPIEDDELFGEPITGYSLY